MENLSTGTIKIVKVESAVEVYFEVRLNIQYVLIGPAGGIKSLLNCCQPSKYLIIFSRLRSGILGAAATHSRGVLIFY